jgi:hypothetical protein
MVNVNSGGIFLLQGKVSLRRSEAAEAISDWRVISIVGGLWHMTWDCFAKSARNDTWESASDTCPQS